MMIKKHSLIWMLLIVSSISIAQNSINSYKYVLVPVQYDFLNSVDQYQLNSLTKFLFNKYGFSVLMENESYPSDLAMNSCLGLKVRVSNNSGLFSTKLKIDLYDCHNVSVFSSSEGRSKEKDYKKAYHEALRDAFNDIQKLNYAYDNSNNFKNKVVAKENIEISKIEKPVVSSKKIEVKKDVIAHKQLKKVKKPKVVAKIADKKDMVTYEIIGTYIFKNWGSSVISSNGDSYSVVGGDEKFQFATIYNTSKPNLFIIKYVAFKQPQLVEINSKGDLIIDSDKGEFIAKRMH